MNDATSEAPNHALGKVLLAAARQQIASNLGLPAEDAATLTATLSPAEQQQLAHPAATFVTLTLDGQLRGCIGRLDAGRPLLEDVRANAHAAAFNDSRFPPLSAAEYPRLHLEISLLTPAAPLAVRDEADACQQLRPGIDGVILETGWHRATFLPQVWEALPDPAAFLAQLKLKAGLPAQGWPADLRLSRYQVRKWAEGNPQD